LKAGAYPRRANKQILGYTALTINRDDEPEPGISTFAKRRAPLHRHATPVRTVRDLANTVDGNSPSPPPFANLAPPALVINKPVYSAFAGHHLHDELMRRHSDTLILTGAETDVCVLSTALGAIDHGYRVIIAEDAVCSSSDRGHDSLLALFAQRFSLQLEVADPQTILAAWAVV
jgi:nicotinamidase-related amidase